MTTHATAWLAPLKSEANQGMGRQGARGLAFLGASQGGKLLLNLLGIFILVRLMPPQEFGLIAMAATVTSFLILFKDAGLTTATMQQIELTHPQVSALFWVNLMVGTALALLTALSAPFIAHFYKEPQLLPVIAVLAVGFVFGGLGAQHDALLRRNLRFGHVAVIELTAAALGLLSGIALALTGWGVWALVAQRVVQMAAYAAGTWLACTWRPSFLLVFKEAAHALRFGAHLSVFNLTSYLGRNGDNILIGWYWGANPLGLYSKAYDLLLGPLYQMTGPLQGTMLPLLARLRTQPERYRAAFTSVFTLATLILIPVGALMVVFPDAIVQAVFGSDWEGAIPVVLWLGVLLPTQILNSGCSWLLISQQRSGELIRTGAILVGLSLVSFAIALPWGIAAVAASYALTGFIFRQPILFWRVGRTGPVSTRHLWGMLSLPLWLAGGLLPAFLLLRLLVEGPWAQLLLAGVMAGLLAPTLIWAVPEGRTLITQALQGLQTGFKKENKS